MKKLFGFFALISAIAVITLTGVAIVGKLCGIRETDEVSENSDEVAE